MRKGYLHEMYSPTSPHGVSAVVMQEVGVDEAKEKENKMEITAVETKGKGETVTVTYKRRFYILALFSLFTMEQCTLS